jgi:hypothetical protein
MNRPVQDSEELEQIEKSFYDSMPDYTKLKNGAELVQALGDEGMKWAAAFCQITEKVFDIKLDLMYVQGWFANAIEHSNDVRRWAREKEATASVPEPWNKQTEG